MTALSNSGPGTASAASSSHALRLYVHAAERSPVPIAALEGGTHEIQYANEAFCHFMASARESLYGRPFEQLAREPSRLGALLVRVEGQRMVELSSDVEYAPRLKHFATTLVTPILSEEGSTLIVHLFDTTARPNDKERLRSEELKQANESLLLASLREKQAAEQTSRAMQRISLLLERKSLLAEVSALLSASLDTEETLHRVVRLVVPRLADCCIVEYVVNGSLERLALAHVVPAEEQRLRDLGPRLLQNEPPTSYSDPVLAFGRAERFAASDAPNAEHPPAAHAPLMRELAARSYVRVPLRARGAVIGVLSLAISESDRGFTGEELELAEELARRTSTALDNARLYREAQQAVELREEVLAVVSHDLQSPLNALGMTVQRLLARTELTQLSGVRSALELIQRTTKHMQHLMAELVEVASIQAGALHLLRVRSDVSALTAQALAMLEPIAQQKSLVMTRQLVQDAAFASCDPERILRVLMNLIGNAIRFTEEHGEIVVGTEALEHDVRVTVRDSGPGIARGDLPKLFEPYWKGKGTGRRGMGLGLYIARGIVQAHGGKIAVESHEGVGSTFWFTLPTGEA